MEVEQESGSLNLTRCGGDDRRVPEIERLSVTP